MRRWLYLVLMMASMAFPNMALAQSKAGATAPKSEAAATDIVVVTNDLLADLVRQLGGEGFRIHVLLNSGDDSETYMPSQETVKIVSQAKLVVIQGLGTERRWLNNLLNNARYNGIVVNATVNLPRLMTENGTMVPAKIDLEKKTDYQGQKLDRRAWMDPSNIRVYIRNITEGLAAADTAQANIYRTRANEIIKSLANLDAWARQSFGGIGKEYRRVVVSFDRFQYFAKAYGMEIIPLSDKKDNLLPQAELQALKERMDKYYIRGIVIQSDAARAPLEAFAKSAGASLFGPVTTENIRELGKDRSGYDAMMREIMTAMYQAMVSNSGVAKPGPSGTQPRAYRR
ncbi:MAG: zinc ABC transporter substrate-binding protein [Alphaproteobacteria bacterium]|nr:MAG: zinc ABC transporter substrate-binding protein [Alphaproteobacteria bacterium]